MSGVLAGTAIAVPTITIAAGVGKIDPSQVREELVSLSNTTTLDNFGRDLENGVSRKGLYTVPILGSITHGLSPLIKLTLIKYYKHV